MRLGIKFMQAKEVLAHLENIQDIKQKIDYLNDMAYIHRFSNTSLMEELSNQALELAQSINDLQRIAKSWRNKGIVNIVYGFFDKAMECLQTALKIYEDIQDESGQAAVAGNIGRVYFSIGQHESAIHWYLKCVERSIPLGLERDLGIAYDNLAEVFMVLTDYKQAIEYVNKAIPIFEKLNELSLLAVAYETLGEIHYKTDNFEEAMQWQLKAIHIAEQIEDHFNLARGYLQIGKIYRKKRNYSESLKSFLQSLFYAEPINNKDTVATAYLQLAILTFEGESFEEAQEYAQKCLKIALETGMKHLEANAYRILSNIYEAQKDYKTALNYYKQFEKVKSETIQLSSEQTIKNIKMAASVEKSEKEKEIYRLKNTELADANIKIQRQKERLEKALKEIEAVNKELEEKNQDILNSIIYAQRIQEAILNSENDVKEILPNSFIFFKPKEIVSGDFFWIAKKEDKILAAACDCTGHGVPAAIISVIGNNLLNDIVINKNILEPGKILTQLHKGIQTILKQNQNTDNETRDGMDIALICIDPIKKNLKFAGAFNNLFISSRGILEEIQGDKYAIGGVQDEVFRLFTTHTFEYYGGECIYLATDGIPNQIGGKEGKRFRYKQFKELLDTVSSLDLDKQKQIIENTFNEWMKGYQQMDDVLVWGIRL